MLIGCRSPRGWECHSEGVAAAASDRRTSTDASSMDLFAEILPGVRETLGDASTSRVEGLLNLLEEEGAISREYRHTLRQEADGDDLARKIALHLVETWAGHRVPGRPLRCPQGWGSPPGDTPSAGPARSDSAMDAGILAGKSCLELLCSDLDPFLLCKQIEEEEDLLPAPAQPADPLGHDPDGNADVFYTVESGEGGEQLRLCSNTGEAYDNIAALDRYVFRDQESVEDLFGEPLARPTPFDLGGRVATHTPALYVVNGSSAAVPLSGPPTGAVAQSSFHLQFCMAARDPVAEAQRQLKTYFQGQWRLAPAAQGAPPEQLYIDSDLAQCPAESRGGRGADPRGCDLHHEPEKARVARSRLLQVAGRPDRGTKIVAVLGKAGAGKSLLAQKVCLDWAEGRWAEFDLLLRFDCRALSPLLEEPCSLRRLLLRLSDGPPGAGDDADAVYRHVLRHPEKLLLVLDGLEALRVRDGLLPASAPASRLGGLLAGLLQRKVLAGCTLLLTAHPGERLHPHVARADRVLELPGFSPQQAELCLARHFAGAPSAGAWLEALRSRPLLLGHCCNPGLCRFLGDFVAEAGGQGLPATLTGLFAQFLRRRLARAAPPAPRSAPLLLPLAEVAWAASQTGRGALLGRHFPSAAAEALAVRAGLVLPLRLPPGCPAEERGYAFASRALQHFLAALHLALAADVRDKRLTQHLQLLARARRPPAPPRDLLPRFLAGLLFLPEELSPAALLGEDARPEAEALLARKRRSLAKLLELCHCVHETRDEPLRQHLARALRPALSFRGVALAPPDVHVLASALSCSGRRFALDLRQAVDLDSLRRLVGLGNVASFRVSLGDAVRLWRHLWQAGQGEQLQAALGKFTVAPFKAETLKDVEDLAALVRMQEDMAWGTADLSGCAIRVIPAVADLRQLDFSLGPLHGQKGFRKLVEILDAFPRLQHLDLDAQNKNEIGDEGVSSLCDVLPRLASLEILNLSQNKITDRGAEQLAKALPSLLSLKTLSMYNNDIGDGGAESMARALPRMRSLKVLDIHCNTFTAIGAQHLIDSLKACPGIQTVA
ncbi:hypothetical protein lerEdw1_004563 [Lerista edwardsae]|nr:hypothetical protein lerEdw1_004563 [Lerista edwardsae]